MRTVPQLIKLYTICGRPIERNAFDMQAACFRGAMAFEWKCSGRAELARRMQSQQRYVYMFIGFARKFGKVGWTADG